MYGQDWVPKAYHVLCSCLVAVFVGMMAALYSRIVYTLWLKRVEDNHSAFQQQVSTSNNTEVRNVKESFVSALHKGLSFPGGARRKNCRLNRLNNLDFLPVQNVKQYHFHDVAKYENISPKESINIKEFRSKWGIYLLVIKLDVTMVTVLIQKLTTKT